MEAQAENRFHPNIENVLNIELGTEHRSTARKILEFLAERTDQDVNPKEIVNFLGVNPLRVVKALKNLTELINANKENFGLEIIKIEGLGKNKKGTAYKLRLLTTEVKTRTRRTGELLKSPYLLEITKKTYQSVSRLIGGFEVMEGAPSNAESLIQNAVILRHEDETEMAFIHELVDAAKKKSALRVEALKDKLNIAKEDRRLGTNMPAVTAKHALELGFVINTIQERYNAIFFLEPEKRIDALLLKYNTDDDIAALDQVSVFNFRSFAQKLSRVPSSELKKQHREDLAEIAKAQRDGNLKRADEYRPHKFDVLKRNSMAKRQEWGFYLRTRTDHRLQIVLIDKDAAAIF